MLEVVEHRIGGWRIFEPAHAYATNKRIIIVRRHLLGIHRSLKTIGYEHITEVIVEKGIIFCKVHFSLIGESVETAEGIKWISGLSYKDALDLVRFVNKTKEKPPVQGILREDLEYDGSG